MEATRNPSELIPYCTIMEIWRKGDTAPRVSYNLIPNKIKGYNSTEEYLKIHFSLLLEDFLYPLKKDLQILKDKKKKLFAEVNIGRFVFMGYQLSSSMGM